MTQNVNNTRKNIIKAARNSNDMLNKAFKAMNDKNYSFPLTEEQENYLYTLDSPLFVIEKARILSKLDSSDLVQEVREARRWFIRHAIDLLSILIYENKNRWAWEQTCVSYMRNSGFCKIVLRKEWVDDTCKYYIVKGSRWNDVLRGKADLDTPTREVLRGLYKLNFSTCATLGNSLAGCWEELMKSLQYEDPFIWFQMGD